MMFTFAGNCKLALKHAKAQVPNKKHPVVFKEIPLKLGPLHIFLTGSHISGVNVESKKKNISNKQRD